MNQPLPPPLAPAIHELIGLVRQWGEAKGITGPNAKATLLAQLAKTQEELTETHAAAVGLSLAEKGLALSADNWREEVADGIGDCTVTLILAAELAGLTFEDCLAHAYAQIKNRTGTMVNGQFVKDAPSA